VCALFIHHDRARIVLRVVKLNTNIASININIIKLVKLTQEPIGYTVTAVAVLGPVRFGEAFTTRLLSDGDGRWASWRWT
jgi:hypothetical protein